MPYFTNSDGIEQELPDTITDGSGNTYDVIIYTLPAYWACYLINGDASGLEDDEIEAVDSFLRREESPWFVDVGESYFSHRNDATRLAGDVCEYVAHVKQTPDLDTFERDDCGAFVYPNGFKMPPEETGAIWEACELWHGGQGSNLYTLMSSGHATPSIICGAALELERAVNSSRSIPHIVAETLQAVEDLNRWAEGVGELVDDSGPFLTD
tara:strand:- start:11 stop:643 length:633 start_codon:yes stop_codon:yes gene_type:complete